MEGLGLYHYWIFVLLMTVGLYAVIEKFNLIKKLVGLSVFQSSVFFFYITIGKLENGTAPIILDPIQDQLFSNPIPQVLILTAIVVSISTTALGLSILIRIHDEYGTIEENEIQLIDCK